MYFMNLYSTKYDPLIILRSPFLSKDFSEERSDALIQGFINKILAIERERKVDVDCFKEKYNKTSRIEEARFHSADGILEGRVLYIPPAHFNNVWIRASIYAQVTFQAQTIDHENEYIALKKAVDSLKPFHYLRSLGERVVQSLLDFAL